jgi:hypothetical protein
MFKTKMKTTLSLPLVLCTCIFFAACKSTSPTAPPDTSKGTPTAVGTPVGTPSSATIDATGGSLMSPDGRLELLIPAGALSAATTISIQPITNETPLGAGLGFDLLPKGQTFTLPVTVRFHYDAADLLGGNANALAAATQTDDRIWHRLAPQVVDEAAGTVSVTTTHFSPYNMYHSLRLIPYHDEIAVKKTSLVAVVFVVEGEADETGFPLSPYQIYAVPSQVSWSVNGTPMGSTQNGTLTQTPNVASATYTAPATTTSMTSNPVAVAATVTIPGRGTMQLISNITVLDAGASGRVSMAINVGGTRTYTHEGTTKTRTEFGSGTLVYDLPSASISDGGGGFRDVNWNEAAFGGSTTQITDESQSYTVICSGGEQTLTDYEKTTTTFSSVTDGLQQTGLGLTIQPNGTYILSIGPPSSLTAGASTNMRWTTGSCFPIEPDTMSGRSPIPFAYYFVAYVGGKTVLGGTIDPNDPNRVKGSYHGTDIVTIFSYGTTVNITMPFEYTITWDIILTK